jgi:putative tricarboxylic transport membrane protein
VNQLKAERVGSLFWLIIGLLSIYGSFQLGVGTLREPGSGFLALLAGGFISLMALIIFFQAFFRGRGFQAPLSTLWQGTRWPRAIAITLLTLGYILALEKLGFLLTSFLLLFIILKGVEKLSWGKAILLPVLTLAISHLLFNVFLKATLPKGIFGF